MQRGRDVVAGRQSQIKAEGRREWRPEAVSGQHGLVSELLEVLGTL